MRCRSFQVNLLLFILSSKSSTFYFSFPLALYLAEEKIVYQSKAYFTRKQENLVHSGFPIDFKLLKQLNETGL